MVEHPIAVIGTHTTKFALARETNRGRISKCKVWMQVLHASKKLAWSAWFGDFTTDRCHSVHVHRRCCPTCSFSLRCTCTSSFSFVAGVFRRTLFRVTYHSVCDELVVEDRGVGFHFHQIDGDGRNLCKHHTSHCVGHARVGSCQRECATLLRKLPKLQVWLTRTRLHHPGTFCRDVRRHPRGEKRRSFRIRRPKRAKRSGSATCAASFCARRRANSVPKTLSRS